MLLKNGIKHKTALHKIYQNVSNVEIEKPRTRVRLFGRVLRCERSLRYDSCPPTACNLVGEKRLILPNL